jgi:hypothetical protein
MVRRSREAADMTNLTFRNPLDLILAVAPIKL